MNIQKIIEAHSDQFIELAQQLLETVDKNSTEAVELADEAGKEIIYRIIEECTVTQPLFNKKIDIDTACNKCGNRIIFKV